MPKLTDSDLDLIRRAREMVAVSGPDAVCEFTGEAEPRWAYTRAFGRAKPLLDELADRLEQLGDA